MLTAGWWLVLFLFALYLYLERDLRAVSTGRFRLAALMRLRPQIYSLPPLETRKEIGSLLRHLRNSLAHSNIFSNTGGKIDQLFFLNRVPEKGEDFYHILAVDVDGAS